MKNTMECPICKIRVRKRVRDGLIVLEEYDYPFITSIGEEHIRCRSCNPKECICNCHQKKEKIYQRHSCKKLYSNLKK